jgi:hypothetical protein
VVVVNKSDAALLHPTEPPSNQTALEPGAVVEEDLARPTTSCAEMPPSGEPQAR